jgi:hypothetical protein
VPSDGVERWHEVGGEGNGVSITSRNDVSEAG